MTRQLLTPSYLFHQLRRRTNNLYVFRLVATVPDTVEPVYLSTEDDIKRLPSGTKIDREKVTPSSVTNPDGDRMFFEANIGPIFFRGNTVDGYYWSIRRFVYSYNEAKSHYSLGWELHDLWGDMDDLIRYQDGPLVLRGRVVLDGFEAPRTDWDSFCFLYKYFNDEVFRVPRYGDLEPYKYRNRNETPTAYDLSPIYQARILTPRHDTDPLKWTTKQKSSIYSIERHHVLWQTYQQVFHHYPQHRFAIDGWGLPIRIKPLKSGNIVLENYRKEGDIYVGDWSKEDNEEIEEPSDSPESGMDVRINIEDDDTGEEQETNSRSGKGTGNEAEHKDETDTQPPG